MEGSEKFDGVYYKRKYKKKWNVNQFKEFKHAVINAFPWKVLKNSEASGVSNSCGIP